MHQRNSSFHFSITFSLQSKYTLQDTIYQRNFSPYKALYIYIYVREVAPSTSQLLSHFSLNTGYSVYQRNFSFFFRSSYFSSLLSSHIYIYICIREIPLSSSQLLPHFSLIHFTGHPIHTWTREISFFSVVF